MRKELIWLMQNNLGVVLTGLTVLTSLLALAWLYHRYRVCKNSSRFLASIIGILAITVALGSSYNILLQPVSEPSKAWAAIANSIVFPVVIFLKLLVFFLIVTIINGLFKPERISEFGAKFLGIEFNQKYTQEEVGNAKLGLDKLQQQLNVSAELNAAVLEYLAGPFEEKLSNMADPAAAIRQAVKDVLIRTYAAFSEINIFVVPLTSEGITLLDEKQAATLRLLASEGLDLVTIEHETVGIGIHHGSDGLGTAIVIDATKQDYEVSVSEICAASTLFVAISTAVDWVLRGKNLSSRLKMNPEGYRCLP